MTTASCPANPMRAKSVIGTNVRDANGRQIGEIEDVMLDKASNSVMFAIVRCGGYPGVAESYLHLQWTVLRYDEAEDAYVVNYTRAQLQAAPADSINELIANDGLTFRDKSYDFYQTDGYWATV